MYRKRTISVVSDDRLNDFQQNEQKLFFAYDNFQIKVLKTNFILSIV